MSADEHYSRGVEYLKQGLLENAEQEFTIAITMNPVDPDAHNDLGVVYKRQGRLDDAIREFETALNLNPRSENAIRNLELVLKIKEVLQLQDVRLAKQAVESITERPVYFEGVVLSEKAEPVLVFEDCGTQMVFSPLAPTPESIFLVAGMPIRVPGLGRVRYFASKVFQEWVIQVLSSEGKLLGILTDIPDQSVENGKQLIRYVSGESLLDLEFIKMTFDAEGTNRKMYNSPIGIIELSTKRVRGVTRGQIFFRDSGRTIDFQRSRFGRLVLNPKERKPWWKFW
jgi:hypothetical protein